MKRWLFYGLWLLTSILFLVAGVLCFIYPDITVASLSYLLGFALFATGINDILTYCDVHQYMRDSGCLLMEGILAIFFAVFCIFNHFITAITIPLIFTIWVIFTGISHITSYIDYRQCGFPYWWLVFVWGILLIGLGIYSIFNPMLASVALSVLFGLLLISQGISSFTKWYYIQKIRLYFKQILK